MAAAAMMFAACSDDLTVDQTAPEIAKNPTEVTDGQVPVTFAGAYFNRATTRSGLSGELTSGVGNFVAYDDPTLAYWNGIEGSGFGVFGYYTGSDLYVAEAYSPNFMYNERVYKKITDGTGTTADAAGNVWVYEPVKYWPNEFGLGAVSDEIDRLTFFAYAPYVTVNSSGAVTNGATNTYAEDNGDATVGIIGLSRNSAMSDPYVKYVVSLDPSKCVDLTYGVAGADITREGLDNLVANGSNNLVDLTKPSTDAKITFDFKHALAALNVQIDAAVDGLNPGKEVGTANNDHVEADETDATATKTRIYVRSITFEGLTDKGMLNLRDHAWYDMVTGLSGLDGTLTVNDGRSDGREAVMAAVNEKNVAFNTEIIQENVDGNPGVTATAVNLFQPVTSFADPAAPTPAEIAARLAEPIYVIPTGQELRVTIVYDVETQDSKLSGYLSGSTTHGISVENAITQTVSSGFKLTAGNTYTLKLHLGMNSVKFDVNEVAAWTAVPVVAETSLPANISGTLSSLKDKLNDPAIDATELANLRALYLNKYIDASGNISSAMTATTIGQIAYITNANGEIDANANLADARILVMSTANAPITVNGNDYTSFPWWNYSTAASTNSVADFVADNSVVGDVTTMYAGTQNLYTIGDTRVPMTTHANYAASLQGYDITKAYNDLVGKYYAAQAAYNYDLSGTGTITTPGYGTDATTGEKGHWFLPTVTQMILMGANDWRSYSAGYAIDGRTGEHNDGPMSKMTSGYYWSSSEYNASVAWLYNANNGYFYCNNRVTSNYSVRPVFAY